MQQSHGLFAIAELLVKSVHYQTDTQNCTKQYTKRDICIVTW